MKIIASNKNIVEKRRNRSLGAISPLFHNTPKEQFLLFSTIFSIYLFQESNYIFICEMWSFDLIFFPQFCKSDMSRYRSQSIPVSPLDFEIMRVNCKSYCTEPYIGYAPGCSTIACLTADLRFTSMSHLSHLTSLEIDHEIISIIILNFL